MIQAVVIIRDTQKVLYRRSLLYKQKIWLGIKFGIFWWITKFNLPTNLFINATLQASQTTHHSAYTLYIQHIHTYIYIQYYVIPSTNVLVCILFVLDCLYYLDAWIWNSSLGCMITFNHHIVHINIKNWYQQIVFWFNICNGYQYNTPI